MKDAITFLHLPILMQERMMADAIASLTATTADAKAITAARITHELM